MNDHATPLLRSASQARRKSAIAAGSVAARRLKRLELAIPRLREARCGQVVQHHHRRHDDTGDFTD